MRSGNLRDKIVLQQQSGVTRDAMGAEVVVWADEHIVWGEVDPYPLRSRINQYRLQGESVVGVRVRIPFNAVIGKRFVFESTPYTIIEIDATRRGRRELMVVGRAEDTKVGA